MYKLLFGLLTITSTSFAYADPQCIPECISGLCLRGSLGSLPTEQQVNRLIGSSGQATSSKLHRKSSCHLISTPKRKDIYAKFDFINVGSKWRLIAITVASQRLCDNPESSSVDFEFLTEKKIGLGSRQEDVIATYGKPKYLLAPPPQDLLESYFPNATEQTADSIVQYVSNMDDLLTTRFFLSQGVVVGIDISADE